MSSLPAMRATAAVLGACLLVAVSARAGEPPGHEGVLGPYPMTRDASGTSWEPDASVMDGLHAWKGSWRLMAHADVFGVFTHQGGPRGGDQWYSTNMLMLAGSRLAAGGMITLRGMSSLEPLMGPKGYREVLQTGETADGRTHLVDWQHPHDVAMELSALYAHGLGTRASAFAYFGLPGEPALGPPAFMHRASAAELPTAPLGHHWLDSTHITYGVATGGVVLGVTKLEASVFNGREPDQERWNVEAPRFDSVAGRVSANPWPWLSVQASAGFLKGPEILHPTIDVRRYTASVSYAGGTRLRTEAMLAWGRNVRSADLPTNCPLASLPGVATAACASAAPPYPPSRTSDAFLLEATVHLGAPHAAFLRAEHVDKDELFPSYDPFHVRVFPVVSVEVGYRYRLPVPGPVALSLGASGGIALLPEFLANEYGHRPTSFWLFASARLR
jgi:hypothetical protein